MAAFVHQRIIEATGYPLVNSDRMREYELFELAKRVLKERSVIVMFVDEMQHALKETDKETIRNLADIIKSLLQIGDWPLHLVLAGVPTLAKFIQHEPQLRNGSLVVELEPVTFPADVARIRKIACGIVEKHASLKVKKGLFTDEFVHRIIHAAEGGFGTAIEIVRLACDLAIEANTRVVTLQHFVDCYQFLTSCQPQHNIFLSADWQSLTPAMPLAELVARQDGLDARIEVAERNRSRKRGAR